MNGGFGGSDQELHCRSSSIEISTAHLIVLRVSHIDQHVSIQAVLIEFR